LNLQSLLDFLAQSDVEDKNVRFLLELKEMQTQMTINSRVYSLIQWLQVFYRAIFGKITRKEAQETKLIEFVK